MHKCGYNINTPTDSASIFEQMKWKGTWSKWMRKRYIEVLGKASRATSPWMQITLARVQIQCGKQWRKWSHRTVTYFRFVCIACDRNHNDFPEASTFSIHFLAPNSSLLAQAQQKGSGDYSVTITTSINLELAAVVEGNFENKHLGWFCKVQCTARDTQTSKFT